MLTERTTTLFVSIFYFQKCQTRDYTVDEVKRLRWKRHRVDFAGIEPAKSTAIDAPT